MSLFYHFGRGCCNLYCRLLYRVEYHGMENLPKTGGYVLASNHITATDPLFIGARLDRQLRFMAKEELFKNGVVGAILKGLGAFPVSRGGGDTSALDRAVEVVTDGGILAIFPEGTRSKDGNLRRLKSGAIYVASQTKANVVPVVVTIENFSGKLKPFSKVRVCYGDVIQTEEIHIDREDRGSMRRANQRLQGALQSLLEESAW